MLFMARNLPEILEVYTSTKSTHYTYIYMYMEYSHM